MKSKQRTAKKEPFFLGLDSSTQSLKATLLDGSLNILQKLTVNFDTDLPGFKTQGGVHRGADGLTVTAPTLMWCAALDLLLEKARKADWPLGEVVAISGSGQQHGSVWFARGGERLLRKLDPRQSLERHMAHAFSFADSPIWMDSSTTAQCRALEKALGGPQAVAALTGSRAYERFTGNQIAKRFQQDPKRYRATEHISLVSSFVASLLMGDYAPIDAADGAGMNLMNIRSRKWAGSALKATAPGLAGKLGSIVPSHAAVGRIHQWFVRRYGFNKACAVIAFSGDNPNSLAGLRLQKAGDVAISLGTSDTVFGSLAQPRPSAEEGHIFANPVEPRGYMALICYKNGSLTRDHVRDAVAGGSWSRFAELVEKAPVGNNGCIGFFIREPEITPPILRTGISRFDGEGRPLDRFRPEVEARAVLESQFLSMRLHGGNVGIHPVSILATGGASVDASVVRVMCDVLGVPVYTGDQADSASLGAAYRALHGWHCLKRKKFVPFAEVMAGAPAFHKAAEPDKAAHAVYTGILKQFAALEKRVIEGK